MRDVVDWDLAVASGTRLLPSGPDIPAAQARMAVDQLRDLAAAAVDPVRSCTGLVAPYVANATEVVDRRTWLRSNVDGLRVVLEPALRTLRDRRGVAARAVAEVGSRATAVQMGGVLAWLSGKVLGQYEAFAPPGAHRRLLLVAPNIVHAERVLGVDERDFRMWVCLHEETHRVQFGAVEWLADHFTAEVHRFIEVSDLDAGQVFERLLAYLRAAPGAVRSTDGPSLVELVQTPGQREVFDRLTALMSLLEGHADYVMDEVGPQVVPSVARIRVRFDARRHHPGAVDGLLRRLLGLDAKMRQYRDGAAFVRGAVRLAGRDGFNRVWSGPQALPTRAEIADPAAWLARTAW